MIRFTSPIHSLGLITLFFLGSCVHSNKLQFQRVPQSKEDNSARVVKRIIEKEEAQHSITTKNSVKAPLDPTEFAASNENRTEQICLREMKVRDKDEIVQNKKVVKQFNRFHSLIDEDQTERFLHEDEPIADSDKSQMRKSFDRRHRIIFTAFFIGLGGLFFTVFGAFFAFTIFLLCALLVYILSIVQITSARKKIPLEEQDFTFQRRYKFAMAMVILGTILLSLGSLVILFLVFN